MLKVQKEIKLNSASFTFFFFFLQFQMFLKYHFPTEVQRWVIGKRIPSDKDTLKHLRITDGNVLYLYLVSAKSVGLNKDDYDKKLMQAQQLLAQGNILCRDIDLHKKKNLKSEIKFICCHFTVVLKFISST